MSIMNNKKLPNWVVYAILMMLTLPLFVYIKSGIYLYSNCTETNGMILLMHQQAETITGVFASISNEMHSLQFHYCSLASVEVR